MQFQWCNYSICLVLTSVILTDIFPLTEDADSKLDYNQSKPASWLRMTSRLFFFLAGVSFIMTINILAAALLWVLYGYRKKKKTWDFEGFISPRGQELQKVMKGSTVGFSSLIVQYSYGMIYFSSIHFHNVILDKGIAISHFKSTFTRCIYVCSWNVTHSW